MKEKNLSNEKSSLIAKHHSGILTPYLGEKYIARITEIILCTATITFILAFVFPSVAPAILLALGITSAGAAAAGILAGLVAGAGFALLVAVSSTAVAISFFYPSSDEIIQQDDLMKKEEEISKLILNSSNIPGNEKITANERNSKLSSNTEKLEIAITSYSKSFFDHKIKNTQDTEENRTENQLNI